MKPVIAFGECLIRLSPPGARRIEQTAVLEVEVGGSEANVVVALVRWGLPARLCSLVPEGPLGDRVIRDLRSFGVDLSAVQRGPGRMGLYYYEHGAGLRGGSVLYDRAHSLFATADATAFAIDRALEGAGWLHLSGITPALSDGAAGATGRAARLAMEAGLPVSLDLNYRRLVWRANDRRPAEVMPSIGDCATLMLAEWEAASDYFGIPLPVAAEDPAAGGRRLADALFDRFPRLQMVLVSRRAITSANRQEYGAALHTRDREYLSPLFEITPMIDRIGAGDALMAGVIHSLMRNPSDPAAAVRFGAVAGALQHTIPGDAPLLDEAEIAAIADGGPGGRLLR